MANITHSEQLEQSSSEAPFLRATHRRLTDQPMRVVWRFVFATLGGWLAMGGLIYAIFQSGELYNAQRFGGAVTMGLTFGAIIGFLALIAGEYPSRLGGLWPLWGRLIVWGVLGSLWGTLAWAAYNVFFLNNAEPEWVVMLFGGVGLALGFLITALFNLPGSLAVVVTTICTYIPLYITFQSYFADNGGTAAIVYFSHPTHIYTIALPFALVIALGAHLRRLLRGRE
ncbi:MAG: hypothetical protein H7175_05020 [Burkholderiales bacterium]|nr:hypothetical protein [Anaerolineae bacterium]